MSCSIHCNKHLARQRQRGGPENKDLVQLVGKNMHISLIAVYVICELSDMDGSVGMFFAELCKFKIEELV